MPADWLEPAIDARRVELHYNNHHKPAATAANRAEEELVKARESGQFALVKHYEKELAYQLSSHILHTIYWTNLGGEGGGPSGELTKAINAEFGSRFKSQLAAVAGALEASGRRFAWLPSFDQEADDPAAREPIRSRRRGVLFRCS